MGLIDVPKSCDMLAATLRSQILEGAYAPGQQLPAERDLVEQTGLSRNAIREGLRILESEGLVQTRLGRYGGSFVCQPTDDMLSRHFRVFARGRGISLLALVQTREAIEPRVAMLAALNRTERDLQAMRDSIEGMKELSPMDANRFLAENRRWIKAVADASQNEILRVFMTTLSELIHDLSGVGAFASEQVRVESIHVYERILDAIVRKDADAAGRRAERHVKAYFEWANNVKLELERNVTR